MRKPNGFLSVSVLMWLGAIFILLGMVSIEYQYFVRASEFHFSHQKAVVLARSSEVLFPKYYRQVPVILDASQRVKTPSASQLDGFWCVAVEEGASLCLARDQWRVFIVSHLAPNTWYVHQFQVP